jgi:hypothetical protein
LHCMGCGIHASVVSRSSRRRSGGGRCRTAGPRVAARPAGRSGVNAAAPRVSVVPLSRARNGCRRTEPCVRGRRRGVRHGIASPHTVTYVYSNGRPVQQRALSRSTARRQRRNVTCPTALPWACGMPCVPSCRLQPYDLDRVASDQNSLVCLIR